MYFKPPSNLRDSFMPYFKLNLHIFEESTNVLLFMLFLSHSSLKGVLNPNFLNLSINREKFWL